MSLSSRCSLAVLCTGEDPPGYFNPPTHLLLCTFILHEFSWHILSTSSCINRTGGCGSRWCCKAVMDQQYLNQFFSFTPETTGELLNWRRSSPHGLTFFKSTADLKRIWLWIVHPFHLSKILHGSCLAPDELSFQGLCLVLESLGNSGFICAVLDW